MHPSTHATEASVIARCDKGTRHAVLSSCVRLYHIAYNVLRINMLLLSVTWQEGFEILLENDLCRAEQLIIGRCRTKQATAYVLPSTCKNYLSCDAAEDYREVAPEPFKPSTAPFQPD